MKLGQTLKILKRFDEANKLFDKAIEIDPYNSEVYFHKGM